MEAAKLYACFEAVDPHLNNLYMIYSAKVSDLLCMESDSKPKFILENIIHGAKYMGCGVYGSKIVFAGGLSYAAKNAAGKNAPKRSKYNLKLITYDPVSKIESREEFPHMRGRKIRPLVFEVCNKLYVFDTSSSVYNWSFEFHNPTGNFWEPLLDPYNDRFSELLKRKTISGRTPYAWFVAGNAISISANEHETDPSFFYHVKQVAKRFLPRYHGTLPFQGMATTYFDPDFSDVVLISFSGGCVEGRRLKFDRPYFGTPNEIFKTEPCIPDGELSSYFADCGDGVFCLTTFDNANIHVYMFKIRRLPDDDCFTLNLDLIRLYVHKYRFSDFSRAPNRAVSISGCFALPSADRAKRIKEAQLYADLFSAFEMTEEDDDDEEEEDADDSLCYETVDGYVKSRFDWPSDNSDSDDPETDVAGGVSGAGKERVYDLGLMTCDIVTKHVRNGK